MKNEFIKYLNENYIKTVAEDARKFLGPKPNTILVTKREIWDLKALDSDEEEFQFKVKYVIGYVKVYDEEFINLILEYTCILDNGIKNLKCINCIDFDEDKFKYERELSPYFIPYMRKEKYEEFAKRFLNKYGCYEEGRYDVDAYDILVKINLCCILAYNITSLGFTIFKDSELNIQDVNGNFSFQKLKKGTIIISMRNVMRTGNLNLEKSTIIHECIHWHYHKKAFEILMLLNDEYKYLECKYYNSGYAMNDMFRFMEVQANALTPFILIDEESLVHVLEDARAQIENDENLVDLPKIDKLTKICGEVANNFQTTLSMTAKRLVGIGYEEFTPLIYKSGVDKYVPTLSKEKLSKDKTRCISLEQYKFLGKNDKTFKFLICHRIYIYADGYIVLNNKKYLDGEYPVQRLNSYARDHIDECSILFNIDTKYYDSKIDSYSYIGLKRDIGNIVIGISMSQESMSNLVELMENNASEEVKREFFKTFRPPIPDTNFSEYLILLMRKYHKTIGELVISSGCSESLIKKYRKADNKTYSKECVLALAAGLKCYPYETHNLIWYAGFNIDSDSPTNKAYRYLVNECYDRGIKYWNQYLEEHHEHKLN